MNLFERKLKFKNLKVGDKFIHWPTNHYDYGYVLMEKTSESRANHLFSLLTNNIYEVDENQKVIKVLTP